MIRIVLTSAITCLLCGVQSAAIATVAICQVLAINRSPDGRSFERPRSRVFSIRQSQFPLADADQDCHDGWFRDQFRCTKRSFNCIVNLISNHWDVINEPIGDNAHFRLRYRVAVCLHYLTHAGSLVESAKVFGMSKSSACRYVEQVVDVVLKGLGPQFIRLPSNVQEWQQLSDGFESVCGFPDTCLAIDGSLFEIEHPADFEGWYCRKGYPAVNAQAVVDHTLRIRDYALRPGSENDKGIYNRSQFGATIHLKLPPGKCIIADAGYQLFSHCLTPYEITDNMHPDDRNYNYLHSKTRIAVEKAFGVLKGRFRRFKAPLNQKGNQNNGDPDIRKEKTGCMQAARIIRACFVFHNVLIDLQDQFWLNRR